jgi:hypothetical protein
VTHVMPWIRALPDLVAFTSFSTELGEVKICLKAWGNVVNKKREIDAYEPKQEVHF